MSYLSDIMCTVLYVLKCKSVKANDRCEKLIPKGC